MTGNEQNNATKNADENPVIEPAFMVHWLARIST